MMKALVARLERVAAELANDRLPVQVVLADFARPAPPASAPPDAPPPMPVPTPPLAPEPEAIDPRCGSCGARTRVYRGREACLACGWID